MKKSKFTRLKQFVKKLSNNPNLGIVAFIVTTIGSIITIIGLIIAIHSVRDFKESVKISKDTADKLKVLNDSLRTQLNFITTSILTTYIGNFPYNLKNINQLIKEDKSSNLNELIIVSDLLAYGCYSNPKQFKEYWEILNSFIESNSNIDLKILYYNEPTLKKAVKIRFEDRNLDTLKRTIKNSFAEYASLVVNEKTKKSIEDKILHIKTLDDFCEVIYLINEAFYGSISLVKYGQTKKISIYTTSHKQPMFVWITSKKAIFSFPKEEKTDNEQAYQTSDPVLIGVFKENSIARQKMGVRKFSTYEKK